MISIAREGQLGNQMFQLAFAHAASAHLRTELSLASPPARMLTRFFDLDEWATPRLCWSRKLAFRLRHPRVEVVTVDNLRDDPAAVLAQLRDGVRYRGYFQSERYFAGYEDDVRRLFSLRAPARELFERRYGELGSYVAMHVRRGDYLQTTWVLPADYYRGALEALGDLSGRTLMVVSDDPALARSELGELDGARFDVNPSIVDLQLLMHADAVITSASSFSWWGAWLNRTPGVRVLAPALWGGFQRGVEDPRDVIPERWTRIPVLASAGA